VNWNSNRFPPPGLTVAPTMPTFDRQLLASRVAALREPVRDNLGATPTIWARASRLAAQPGQHHSHADERARRGSTQLVRFAQADIVCVGAPSPGERARE